MYAPPLQPGCPWSALSLLAPPNVDWCEAPLCSWVVEPANTWSNIAYLLVALLLWRRSQGKTGRGLGLFAPAMLLTGLFSLVYHASYNFFTQFFDFVGMFLWLGLLLAINRARLGAAGGGAIARDLGFVVAGGSVLVVLFYLLGIPIQLIVLGLIFVLLGQEIACSRRPDRPDDYRWYAVMLVLLASASVFSALDVTRVFCDPDNHFLQGHATWHLLSALSMAAGYMFYEQLGARGRG